MFPKTFWRFLRSRRFSYMYVPKDIRVRMRLHLRMLGVANIFSAIFFAHARHSLRCVLPCRPLPAPSEQATHTSKKTVDHLPHRHETPVRLYSTNINALSSRWKVVRPNDRCVLFLMCLCRSCRCYCSCCCCARVFVLKTFAAWTCPLRFRA